MLDSLGQLFSFSEFMPHGHCYLWKPEIVWTQVLANAGIALAYFAIPFVLLHFIRRRPDLPFHGIFALFAAFILLCGVTHVMDIVTLWIPAYRLDGLVRVATAVTSIITAIALYPLIPQALALRSPRELEAKNRALQEAERARSDFFAGVSHELRTPLALMIAPLESMLSEAETLPPNHQALLHTVHGNSLRLLQMINGLLDFSKLEAGRIEVQREPLDLDALTDSLLNDFKPLYQRKQVSLVVQKAGVSQPVLLDRHLFERIVFNLVSNALKFTPEGGEVKVRVQHAEGRLVLQVQDTGPGIAESDLPKLFQRFRQIESSSARRVEGTGLGLSLVKEFSELLDGNASVKSEVGVGSTFQVDIACPTTTTPPLTGTVTRPAFLTDNPPTLPPLPTNGDTTLPKVLVAEDNPELGAYIATLLKEWCQVRVVADGEQALQLARKWPADLVLTDVMMPVLNGLELCRALRENPATAEMPVVLLTALTHREALLEGWRAGASEYLFKPFHPAELITRIRSLLVLVQTRKQAEIEHKRSEELEQFAYFASHDLKEPLRTLSQMSQLLRARYGETLKGDGEEYMGYIVEAADRMRQIIENLVRYSVLDAEKPESVPVDMEQVLQQARKSLMAAIEESGAKLEIDPLPVVQGDPFQLVQLLTNLISNGIKFRKPDTVPVVRLSVEKVEGQAVFTLRDNGIGFDPRYAERIFVIFKRLHARTEFAGTGIGLAICKRIVERLGGRIWAESKPGEGAAFHFTLPLAKS